MRPAKVHSSKTARNISAMISRRLKSGGLSSLAGRQHSCFVTRQSSRPNRTRSLTGRDYPRWYAPARTGFSICAIKTLRKNRLMPNGRKFLRLWGFLRIKSSGAPERGFSQAARDVWSLAKRFAAFRSRTFGQINRLFLLNQLRLS